jgi:TldD protein
MLDHPTAERVIQAALDVGADFAELFCEDRSEAMIEEQKGEIRNVTSARLYGAGISVLNGAKSSYTYTNDLTPAAFTLAAREAASAFRCGSQGLACAPFKPLEYASPNPCLLDPSEVPPERKAALLHAMDAYARSVSPLVRNIKADYFETEQKVTVFNSEGVHAKEKRLYCRVRLTITVGDGERAKAEWHDLVRNDGFGFTDAATWQSEIRSLIDRMALFLHAESAPSGLMDVVFEKGESSLFHEAVGHPFEGWAVSEGLSVFSGKLGQRVASDKVTLVDSGAVPGLYGSTGMDDTGQPTGPNVLIRKGILAGYMLDRVSARKLGMQPTANARRQNYTYQSCDRMTNTYIEPGEDDDDEMIASLEHGLFVKSIGGGATNPVTGAFNVEVTEGYLIENGRITRPITGMTISGTSDVLMKVDRVGAISPLPLHEGGFCGGGSGLVPVTTYQPRLRMRGLVVGGKGGTA